MAGIFYPYWNANTRRRYVRNAYIHMLCLIACLKPSIQKLVSNLAQDCLAHLHEEAVHTDAYTLQTPRIEAALRDLQVEFSPSFVDEKLLAEVTSKTPIRVAKRNALYHETVRRLLLRFAFASHQVPLGVIDLRSFTESADSCTCHGTSRAMFLSDLLVISGDMFKWRLNFSAACFDEIRQYQLILLHFLRGTLLAPSQRSGSLHKGTSRNHSVLFSPKLKNINRALTKLLAFAKARTYSKSSDELWLEEWKSELQTRVPVTDPSAFLRSLEQPIDHTAE